MKLSTISSLPLKTGYRQNCSDDSIYFGGKSGIQQAILIKF